MALVWVDGFEGYGDTDNGAPAPTGVLADKYRWVGEEGQMDMNSSTTRWGSGWVLEVTGGGSIYQSAFDTENIASGLTTIAGVSMRINSKDGLAAYNRWPIIAFKNEDGNHNVHLLHCKGTLEVLGPNDTWLASTRVNLERFTYHYVEMKVYHDQSSGTVEVRVNGCPVLNLTSVNTQHTSAKGTERIGIGGGYQPGSSQYMRIDDFYACDGTGTKNNDFLGPVRIETLWPTSDDSVSWTTTGNTSSHYDNVDRNQRDGSTDYVGEDNSGVLDRFGMGNTAVTWDTVHGIAGWYGAWYTGTGNNTGLQGHFDSNGTTCNSANMTLTTSVLFDFPHIVETDPDTGNSWNGTTINALKCGFRTP